MHRLVIALTVSILASSCADIEISEGAGPLGLNCPTWGCGTNAASMGQGLAFHELEATGHAVNDAGLRLIGFRRADGTAMQVVVDGDELRGVTAGGVDVRGGALVGSYFVLRHEPGGVLYKVKITDVSRIPFWVGGVPTIAPAYTFTYVIPGGLAGGTLCSGKPKEPQWIGYEQTALIFTGDRYDAVHKRVSSPSGSWFNVACAGTAVAKMHLLRHTQAGSDATHTTTVAQRQAMLKLITNDICGTGRSFTEDGEPLLYMDGQGFYPFALGDADTFEAIWSHRGAVCLDEPRRLAEEPDILGEIAAECGGRLPPRCGRRVGDWTSYGYGLSANP